MSLMVKIMESLGIAGAHLKIMTTNYTKSVVNITVRGENLGALLVQNRKKTEVFTLSASLQGSA